MSLIDPERRESDSDDGMSFISFSCSVNRSTMEGFLDFNWDEYLRETKSTAAAASSFQQVSSFL